MPAWIDITGQKFGRLTAVSYLGNRRWRSVCECGGESIAKCSDLRSGQVLSCGCFNREKNAIRANDLELVTAGFWSNVDRLGPASCWLWNGSVTVYGYGQFGTKLNGKRKNWKAHRFSYWLASGCIGYSPAYVSFGEIFGPDDETCSECNGEGVKLFNPQPPQP